MSTKEFIKDVHTPKHEEQVSDYCRQCIHFGIRGHKCRGLSIDSIYDICAEYVEENVINSETLPLPVFI